MAYSKSRSALIRVQRHLDLLLNAKEGEDIAFKSHEPDILAGHIREALYVAGIYPEYSTYLSIKNNYQFRVKPDKMIAEWKHKVLDPDVIPAAMTKMRLDGISDILGIVGAAITHKATELHFPSAELSDVDLSKLYNWSITAGYFIIDNGDLGVTLTKNDPGEIAWSPE